MQERRGAHDVFDLVALQWADKVPFDGFAVKGTDLVAQFLRVVFAKPTLARSQGRLDGCRGISLRPRGQPDAGRITARPLGGAGDAAADRIDRSCDVTLCH